MNKELSRKKFLLELKKSLRNKGVTYCVGVFNLGTPQAEFIVGETDIDKEYKVGEEIDYIYEAEYVDSLQIAMAWLKRKK